MKTFPLEYLTLEEAKKLQFKLVETITRHFSNNEFLNNGDLGVVPGLGRPKMTAKVERTIAEFFGAEDAVLVRGAGTGAIRLALQAAIRHGDKVLVHDAPIYSTTATTFEFMGLDAVKVDMNRTDEVLQAINGDIKLIYIQHSRQKSSDSYDMYELIRSIKHVTDVPIITDENYTVFKTRFIGTQVGATLSCFSCFKLFGPEGIGCVVGKKSLIDKIRGMNYSGGSQVQGYEAMDVLRSMVFVPVMAAIQAEEIERIADIINSGKVEGAESAYVANAQSRVVLVRLREPIAARVIEEAGSLGAATYPVGAESKYEIVPMFYRASGTFIKENPELNDYVIRINPMRAGHETVIKILKEAIRKAR